MSPRPDGKPTIAEIMDQGDPGWRERDAKNDTCDHVGTGRVQKFDGGRLPILCGRCYMVLAWAPR